MGHGNACPAPAAETAGIEGSGAAAGVHKQWTRVCAWQCPQELGLIGPTMRCSIASQCVCTCRQEAPLLEALDETFYELQGAGSGPGAARLQQQLDTLQRQVGPLFVKTYSVAATCPSQQLRALMCWSRATAMKWHNGTGAGVQ